MQATVTSDQRVLLWVAPALATVFFVALLMTRLTGEHVPIAVLVFSGALFLLAWWSFMSDATVVSLEGDRLSFVTRRRCIAVDVESVTRIDARVWKSGYILVATARHKIYLLRSMDNVGPLLAEVCRRNAATQLRGRLPG